jgi:hypothetical protein
MKLPAAAAHGISAELAPSFEKLVVARREGYCYEHNGLFSAALLAAGFDVYEGAARVAKRQPDAPPGAEPLLGGHDHRIGFVHLDGRTFLVDVGFGSDVIPLPLRLPEEPYATAEGEPGDAPYLDTGIWSSGGGGEAALLPLERAAGFRVRLGLPGTAAAPDPGSTPHFAHRVGYYLQKLQKQGGGGDPYWRDLYFFRRAGVGLPRWSGWGHPQRHVGC